MFHMKAKRILKSSQHKEKIFSYLLNVVFI